MNSQMRVAVSFAEADQTFAEKIVEGLIEHHIIVYSTSQNLQDKISNWGKTWFELVDYQYSEEINYCIVLITDDYIKTKWKGYNRCILLQTAFERKDFILPVVIGPVYYASLSGLGLYAPLEIQPGEFQTVIDAFIEKAQSISHVPNSIRRYREIETILRLHYKEQEITKHDKEDDFDSERKIGFDLFSITEPTLGHIICYVLYLYPRTTLKNTHEYLQRKYSQIFKNDNLIVLFPLEKNQKDFDRRKANISELFATKRVHYIQEFLWEYCTPKDFRSGRQEYQLKNLVPPYVKGTDRADAITYLKTWIDTNNNPILVVTGEGGIGKTTVAKWMANEVYHHLPNTRIIFIASIELIHLLKRKLEYVDECTLYTLYEVDHEDKRQRHETQEYKLSEDEFRCYLDNGNIIIIIDGLDEIISQIGKLYDLNSFILSIYDSTNDIGNGKILITCRNYFWDTTNPTLSAIDTVELQPFDTKLAERYFTKYYPNHPRLTQLGLQIASALSAETNGEKEFIPFVLDVTTFIIDSKFEIEDIQDIQFNSRFLQEKINNDYLIYKICSREVRKYEQVLNTDQQIEFFIRLATIYNGSARLIDVTKEIENISNNQASKENIEAFNAHPLIYYNLTEQRLSFKYDLLEEHFKNIYIGEILSGKIAVDVIASKILADHNNYKSIFIETLSARFATFNDSSKLQIIKVIDEIKQLQGNLSKDIKINALSAIFLIALRCVHNKSNNNITKNTELLKELFSANNTIEEFAIVNMTSINSPRIIFDFSNLTFKQSYFINYEYFKDCRFTPTTLFIDSTFEDIAVFNSKKPPFLSSNFQGCRFDVEMKRALRQQNTDNKDTRDEVYSDITSFFSAFYGRGTILNCRKIYVQRKYKAKIISFSDMIKHLEGAQIIREYRPAARTDDKYLIQKEYHEDIIKFLTEEKLSAFLNKVFTELFKKYKK